MAMEISQSALARLWLYAFLLGVGLGAVYDALRILRVFLGVSYSNRFSQQLKDVHLPLLPPRRATRPSRWLPVVIFVQDVLFGVVGGVGIVILFYWFNNGKIRIPAILCALAGMLVYRVTLGRIVMLFSEVIAAITEWVFRYLFFFVTLPFRFLFKGIRRAVGTVYRKIREKRRFRARMRLTGRSFRQIENNACGLLPRQENK